MYRDEKEWKAVMDTVGRISGLLDNVGKSCVDYNLREDDLPEQLCNILREMTTYAIHSRYPYCLLIVLKSKLDELRRELTQGWKVLSRDSWKMKVQQCDRELSDLIKYFLVRRRFICLTCITHCLQSELLLDALLAQIAHACRVRTFLL